ncbi:MAG TPA: hypothetical protein VN579_00775 [Bryobacteraceae bacterium]|nr:hypothetical protein [Bryobacteraceae bacterium]
MSKFIGIIVGGIEIVGGVLLTVFSGGTLAYVGGLLIAAGVGTVLSGVGTLLGGAGGGQNIQQGIATAVRNPIAPWLVVFGRSVVGGTIVFLNEFGDQNKYLDMVIVLAAHKCQAVDGLLFDKQLVQMSTDGGAFTGVGCSFTPVQQTVNIVKIIRSKGIVTVVMAAAIPLLSAGYFIRVQDVSGDHTLNGKWPVDTVVTGGAWSSAIPYVTGEVVTYSGVSYYAIADGTNQQPDVSPTYWIVGYPFRYISGGDDAIVDNEGTVQTLWPDYGKKVHMEVLLGDHTDTFVGMTWGTADDSDDSSDHSIVSPNNPWDADHKLLGKTCVFLRLHFDEKVFAGGLPQISFLVRGKSDIYDPRTSPPSYGYSENAALCIADYLAHPTWGFRSAYGSEIPLPQLIAAANICDETVALASGGSEPRYTVNGKFDLSASRGEVLQNLLTSCAGRLTYQGGQFIIWPAAWNGTSPSTAPSLGNMSGPFRWKPTSSIRDLYNGVKGTYVSPANNWQASDIPAYAQDEIHGYPEDDNLIADGGERRWLDIQLPFTISSATAQRLCKIELLRRRHQGTGTFRYNMAGYSITAMDVIQKTLPFFGWENKLLEVLAHRFTIDKQSVNGNEVTLLGTEVDVQETDSSIYDWSDSEELTAQGYQQPAVPDGRTPAPPANVTLTSNSTTVIHGPGGKVTDVILVSWDAPTDGYVLNGGHIEVRYRLQGDTAWTGLPSVNPSVTAVRIVGVVEQSVYEVQVRSVNAGGTPSDWVSDADGVVRATGARVPLSLKPYGEQNSRATYGYAPTLAVDSARGVIRVGATLPPNVVSDVMASAPVIDDEATVSAFVTGNLPVGDFLVLAYAVDAAGKYSAPSNPMHVTILNAASQIFFSTAWPAGAVGYQLFFGEDLDSLVCDWDPIIASPVSLPANITITSIGGVAPRFSRGGLFGPPDSRWDRVHVRAKTQIHDSIAAVNAYASTLAEAAWSSVIAYAYGDRVTHSGGHFIALQASTNQTPVGGTITSYWAPVHDEAVLLLPPSPLTVDALAGRALSIISKVGLPSTQPWEQATIVGNSASGVLFLDTPMNVDPGDLLAIGTLADTVTGNSIGDSGLAAPTNVWAPGGLTPNEGDFVIRIVHDPTGAATGHTSRVLGNTGTVYTVEPWDVVPGIGSQFVVEESTWKVNTHGESVKVSVAPNAASGPAPVEVAIVPTSDLQGKVALVQITLEDVDGNESAPIVDDIREIYVPVQPTEPSSLAPGQSSYAW